MGDIMMKYIQQLENRNEYYLPLVDVFERGEVGIREFQIPLSFYIKYSDLFEEGKSYISLFKKIDLEKYWRENSFLNYNSYMEVSSCLERYDSIEEELYCIIQEYNKIDFKERDVECFISIIISILKLLKDVYPHNKDIYEKSLNKFETAYDELKKLNSIVYNKNVSKYKKVFLPDSWFILPNQILYNTGNGHKGSNLVNDFDCIVNTFEHAKSLEKVSKYYFDLEKSIKENGFTEGQFKSFLNLIYFPAYTDTTHEIPTCHEKYTLDHIIGIVMAKAYFYHFFENMQNYCLNLKKEFNKLRELTNNELSDIFVR